MICLPYILIVLESQDIYQNLRLWAGKMKDEKIQQPADVFK
jgi:hypothetical protein